MHSHVSVETGEPNQRRDGYANKGRHRLAPEAGKTEIEPHHIGLNAAYSGEQAKRISDAVEFPAALYGEVLQFGFRRRKIVPQHGERESGNLLQFPGNMVPVLVKGIPARWKCADQTDIHCCPGLKSAYRDSFPNSEK